MVWMRRFGGRPAGRLIALGVFLVAAGLSMRPASALMPPYVYESARDNAASVIVLSVEKVTPPRRPFGNCAVAGTVEKVERGTAYQIGQKVSVDVPCAAPDAMPPIGGTIYQQIPELTAAKFGRAYLDENGKVVLSQYEQLKALP